MKILFLTPYLPSPPRSGGPRRVHGLMTGLAANHDVAVLSLVDPREDQTAAINATRAYCRAVTTVPNNRHGLATSAKRRLQLRSLLSAGSFERLVYHEPAFQVALDRLLAHDAYDIINVEFAQMAPYRFPRGGGRRPRVVLDEHNIEYDILRRTFAAEAGFDRKFYSYVNYWKLRREERAAWRRVDGCSLTSTRDERLLRDQNGAVPTAVVPNGVDVEDFRPGTDAACAPATLVFFGAISYYPNTDGLLFFLREIWPLLRARHPDVRLRIVGPEPPPSIARWAGEAIEVTGFVDDVRPYIAGATAIIAPLRIGGGTRLKIVEAMAMGKTIVATPIGAEGLDVADGEDILLADDAAGFAAQIGRALDDAALRERLGRAARYRAETCYSWRASVARLERLYQRLLTTTAPGTALSADTTAAGLQTRAG